MGARTLLRTTQEKHLKLESSVAVFPVYGAHPHLPARSSTIITDYTFLVKFKPPHFPLCVKALYAHTHISVHIYICACNVHYDCNPQPLPFKSQTFLNKVKPLLPS